MKASEIRQMSKKEILDRIDEEQENLVSVRFLHASSQQTDTSVLQKTTRDIARLKTVLQERQLSGDDK